MAWVETIVLKDEGVHLNPKGEMELIWWAPGRLPSLTICGQTYKELKLLSISI